MSKWGMALELISRQNRRQYLLFHGADDLDFTRGKSVPHFPSYETIGFSAERF